MSASESHLPTVKTILSAAASMAATVMVVRGVAQEFLPYEFQDFIFSRFRNILSRFSNEMTIVVEEFDGLDSNEIYEAAQIYLGSKISPSTRRLRISKLEQEKHFKITMERNEEIVDVYNGQNFKWTWICTTTETSSSRRRDMNSAFRFEVRSFELTFHKKNREMVIDSYLPFITNEAKIKKQEKRTIKIYMVDPDNMYDISQMWKPVTLDHPATFETLAMDLSEKDVIMKDIERFLSRREYYRKVGKAWKRGYLLYGPPGTGKSTLIAAMANYLNFDVYDLELTELTRNSDLRKLLLATANKSILVVEDIDCTIDLQEKLANRDTSPAEHHSEESQVTLSGLLNFVDGLWSSCGDERIIIFTTNHIEKLDPALLRPGRMDVHINMSYCTPCGFRQLASNYHGIKDHPRFKQIEDLLPNAKVTPAEVAEQLLKSDDPHTSLQDLVHFMHEKLTKGEDAKDAAETPKKEHVNAEEAPKKEHVNAAEKGNVGEKKYTQQQV